MNFKSLEDRMLYFRSMSDYKLIPNSYVIMMLDGRAFSRNIKNRYNKPFDDRFIHYMNETAKYLCANIQGCKFAYTQSDEITLVITDFDTPLTDAFFDYRLCKMQSIAASMASSKFNQLLTLELLETPASNEDIKDMVKSMKLLEFDCKAWNVPSYNDVFSWLLYRQIDCIKNSKQQAAQTYISHKELLGLNTDIQVQLLKKTKGIDWNDYKDDRKYGRFIYKVKEMFHNDKMNVDYERSIWKEHDAFPLNEKEGKEKFNKMNIIPII